MQSKYDSHVFKYKMQFFPFKIFLFSIFFFFFMGLSVGMVYGQWQSDNIYRSLLEYKFTQVSISHD